MAAVAPPQPVTPVPATPPIATPGPNTGSGSRSSSGGAKKRTGRGASRRSGASSADYSTRVTHTEHLSRPEVERSLQAGELFTGALRVNAHKRFEAYVSLEGFPCDVLFDGFAAQNRALDGDVVAFKLLPPDTWPLQSKDKAVSCTPDSSTNPLGTPAEADDNDGESDGSDDDDLGDAVATLDLDDPCGEDDSIVPLVKHVPPPCDIHPPGGCGANCLTSLRTRCVGPPPRRPLGFVVAIYQAGQRREQLVGYLEAPQGARTSPQATQQQLSTSAPSSTGGRNAPRGNASGPALSRSTSGRDESQWFWRFTPADPKLPRFNVEPARLCADAFTALADGNLGRTLFLGTFLRWSASASCPLACIRTSLGEAGTIEAETKALIAEYELPDEPFSDAALACLPRVDTPGEWTIAPEEVPRRRDFRQEMVFSIDPPTARDLDDALSIQELPGGGFTVGVHIADVSHFVESGCALDEEARRRATSTYLVQRVIPMLPRLLCEELCSLNPGVDRLTYSVVWTLDGEGNIKDEWFGKGIICTAAKLDYAIAQAVIDADSKGTDTAAPLDAFLAAKPEASRGAPSTARMASAILQMHGLAQKLRAARFTHGALRLDNPKLTFALDQQTGDPLEVRQYITGQSHQLVEEFMLLANRRVATFIAERVPRGALLRRHAPPDGKKMDDLRAFSAKHGLSLDTSSSGALHSSLARLVASRPEAAALATLMVTKPMQLAQYFSTADIEDSSKWGHYALAMDRYTHFTSPIRRYADVLVHRALSAALMDASEVALRVPPLLLPKELISAAAQHCNARKYVAKTAQEASAQVFLCAMLRKAPRVTRAHVLNTGQKYLHVFLPDYGFETRVGVEQKDLPRGVTFTPVAGTPGAFVARAGAARNDQARRRKSGADAQAEPPVAVGSGQGIQPAILPLHVAAFSCVPVVLSATTPEGKRSEVQARLHIAAM